MRLGVKPAVFLGRLLLFFFLTYVLWKPFAPAYTQVLAFLTRGFLHLTELSSDPNLYQVTEMGVRETAEGRPAIYYRNRLFPQVEDGIAAEWVQAGLVLLIPLMLATPARSYRQRFSRLGLALAIWLVLQVFDIAVTVKYFYATQLGDYSARYHGDAARFIYGFGNAFTQAMDAALFPVAIWAGIHFNLLLGREQPEVAPPAAPARPAAGTPAAPPAVPRRKRKASKKAAR
jgi:hypothetical protein